MTYQAYSVWKVARIVGEYVDIHYTIIRTVYMTNMTSRICMSTWGVEATIMECCSQILKWMEFLSHSSWVLRKPDKAFIENYESIVPDIVELANYNIGLQEAARQKSFGKDMCPRWPRSSDFLRCNFKLVLLWAGNVVWFGQDFWKRVAFVDMCG